MIVVQSPLRISLFGGGTDFPSFFLEEGGAVLSSTIDKYIYVNAKKRFDQKLRLGYTKTEMVDQLDQIQHELFRESLRKTGISRGVEITTLGDIPSAGSGLGSSSTVTVGTLLALYGLLGESITADQLAQEACDIELNILNKPIGIQDQYIVGFGGLRFIEFTNQGEVVINHLAVEQDVFRKLNESMLLFYSGVTRKADTILAEQQSNIQDRLDTLREMKSLAYAARDELVKGNLEMIGRLMHFGWGLKKQLASKISNHGIDEIYLSARQAGALGGKVTGAGGGGFILLYCPPERQERVRSALRSLQELPFRLEPDGAKIIFNYKRESGNLIQVQNKSTKYVTRFAFPERISPDSTDDLSQNTLDQPRAKVNTPHVENQNPVNNYLGNLHWVLDQLSESDIMSVILLLHEARLNQRNVLILGNGGSASTASHFACDLAKNCSVVGVPRFNALSLADNMAIFSAYANDDGYESVFAEQLENIVQSQDVVIGISTSGKSKNVLRAIELANQKGAVTVGFTGNEGGELINLVDHVINVPTDNIERIEDVHLILEHLIVSTLRAYAEQSLIESDLSLQLADQIARGVISEPIGAAGLLFEINQYLLEATDPLSRILEIAIRELKARSGSILTLNQKGKILETYLAYNDSVVKLPPERLEEIVEQGLAGWVYSNRTRALVTSTRDDPRWLRRSWDENSASQRSAISVPVITEDHVAGIITLVSQNKSPFTEHELALLSAIALCISMSDSNYRSKLIDIESDMLSTV